MASDEAYFLCVDDESGDRLEPLLERLRRSGVAIRLAAPNPFDKEVTAIRSSDAAGLLLDLRLDDMPGRKGRVQYHALALAQELRTRMTEGDLRSMPIVLWSIERKFRKSYSSDTTAHDLFDLVISKTQVSEDPRPIARKLVALATDYPLLKTSKAKPASFWARILGLESAARDQLDPRIGAEIRGNAPAHEYARYVIRELLSRPGPLIDEAVLAVRLGVSRASADWDNAKLQIESAKYSGVFSSGWVRWWWPVVERELRQLAPETPFRAITAIERVDILKRSWGLSRLDAVATPGHGSRFWHVCAVTYAPLDPVDAVTAESGERKPWQEAVYISTEAALSRRAAAKGIRVHPLEEARLEAMTHK
jgi:hypothetical protein